MTVDPERIAALLQDDRMIEMLEMWKRGIPPHLGSGEHAVRESLKTLLRIEAFLRIHLGREPRA
jgi:hypothetical protein